MRLVRLNLTNFMGAKNSTFDFGGLSATIRGTNESGKTTIVSAFTWLLSGKDAMGQAVFDIKPLTADGEAVHNLESSVEGIFDIGGGELLSLRKVYAEVWTHKRGQADRTFTGHEVKHFVDGVPMQKKEFDSRIAEFAPEGVFRLLTDPDAFHALHWEKRRAILLEVVGDLSDAEVIASREHLADLTDVLGRYSVDDYRRIAKARRAEVNKELPQVQTRIDEVSLALENLPEVDEASAQAGIDALDVRIIDLQAQRLENNTSVDQSRLREIDWSLRELEQAATRTYTETVRKAKDAATQARHTASATLREADALQAETTNYRSRITTLEARMATLRSEYGVVKARAVTVHTEDTCPACQQALPHERVEAAHAAAVADLNAKKAAELERIQAEGLNLKTQADDLTAKVADAEGRHAVLRGRYATEDAAARELEAAAVPPAPTGATGTPEHRALTAERAEVEARIAAGDTTAANAAIDQQIAVLRSEQATSRAAIAAVAQRASLTERIAALDEQQATLNTEFELLERHMWLLDEFERAKSALLTDKINARFTITKFRLFEKNINGGIEPACTATVNGVPYGTGLNRANRINSGLDVIRVLQDHYNCHPPVLADECESVVNILPLDGQLIRLVVDGKHPTLKVELDKELIAA